MGIWPKNKKMNHSRSAHSAAIITNDDDEPLQVNRLLLCRGVDEADDKDSVQEMKIRLEISL